jgi:hypothetical protein
MSTAYNGRIDAAQREGRNLKISWSGGIYDLDYWVIPKGTADLTDASPETWHNDANAPSPQTSAHADPDELCRTRGHLQEEADPT